MSFRLYNSGHVLVFVNTEHRDNKTGDIQFRFEKLPRNKTWYEYDNLAAPILYSVYFDNPERNLILDTPFTDFQKEDGTSFASDAELIAHLDNVINLLDVAIQDQFTDAVIANFNRVTNSTELTNAVAIDDLDIIVDDATGASAGSYIILFHPGSVRFSVFTALTVVSTTITLDTPIDFAYPAGTFVDIATINLAVDGSSTTQTFGLRGTGTPLGVALSVDITRIIFTCITAAAVDLSKFGDIAAGITNGLVLRKRDGTFHNVFNVKTNGDMANLMFDWVVHDAQNLQQGQHGFIGRLTFAGQNKIGVTIRLVLGEDLEFLVQDALQTITSLKVIAEGHIVE